MFRPLLVNKIWQRLRFEIRDYFDFSRLRGTGRKKWAQKFFFAFRKISKESPKKTSAKMSSLSKVIKCRQTKQEVAQIFWQKELFASNVFEIFQESLRVSFSRKQTTPFKRKGWTLAFLLKFKHHKVWLKGKLSCDPGFHFCKIPGEFLFPTNNFENLQKNPPRPVFVNRGSTLHSRALLRTMLMFDASFTIGTEYNVWSRICVASGRLHSKEHIVQHTIAYEVKQHYTRFAVCSVS